MTVVFLIRCKIFKIQYLILSIQNLEYKNYCEYFKTGYVCNYNKAIMCYVI